MGNIPIMQKVEVTLGGLTRIGVTANELCNLVLERHDSLSEALKGVMVIKTAEVRLKDQKGERSELLVK